jgi:hypothetical protein
LEDGAYAILDVDEEVIDETLMVGVAIRRRECA